MQVPEASDATKAVAALEVDAVLQPERGVRELAAAGCTITA